MSGSIRRFLKRKATESKPGDADDQGKPQKKTPEQLEQNTQVYHGELPSSETLYRAQLQRRVYPDNFLRPPYTQPTHTQESIEFFIEQIDCVNSLTPIWDVLEKHRGKDNVKRDYWSFFVRLFGTTAEGHNVCCYMSGFNPHTYVEVPSHWNSAHVAEWLESLEEQPDLDKLQWNISKHELVWRKNIYGYTNSAQIRMLKIYFKNASSKRKFCNLLSSEPKADFDMPPPDRTKVPRQRYFYRAAPKHRFWLWDTEVNAEQQLLNETGIGGCRWVKIAAGGYTFHNMSHVLPHERRSRAQIDIDTKRDCVSVLHDRIDIPPFLIYSLDSETMRGARDRIFPKSSVPGDELFQWGGSVMRFGDDYSEVPLFSAVHCTRPTDNLDPDKIHINEYANEKEMLDAYLRFFRDSVNPNVVLGFNTYGFDYKYFEDRAKRCLTSAHCDRNLPYKYGPYNYGVFEYGCVRGELSEARFDNSGSKAHGSRESFKIKMAGRTQIDLLKWASEEWKIPRKLAELGKIVYEDAASGDKTVQEDDFVKLDLPFYKIHDKFVGTSHDRGQIAEYCAVDTHVPMRILHVKKVLLGVIEIARLTGLTMDKVINQKQMARTYAMISKYAHDRDFVIPECPQRFVLDEHLRDMMFGEGSYTGATVIDPITGYYDCAVSTLDFAALYPSIMRGFRLCYTSLVLDPKHLEDPNLKTVSIEIPNGDPSQPPYQLHWVQNEEPLLYGLITQILNARADAKKLKKQHANNPFLEALYDAKQLGLKLIANSCYGFTGAKIGKLPNLALAASVTYFGRQLIELTRDIVHREEPDCRVIYGDSVTGDTPIHLLVDETVHTVRFDHVAEFLKLEWTPFHAGKESLELERKVCVWSETGFVPIKRFIRHELAAEKELMRVHTATGLVDVTEDHSLLEAETAKRISPKDVVVGESLLLHRADDADLLRAFTKESSRANIDPKLAFFLGVTFAYAHFAKDKLFWSIDLAGTSYSQMRATWLHFWFPKQFLDKINVSNRDRKLVCETLDRETIDFFRNHFIVFGSKSRQVPECVLYSQDESILRAFFFGTGCGKTDIFTKKGSLVLRSKLAASQYWIVCRKLGLDVCVENDTDHHIAIERVRVRWRILRPNQPSYSENECVRAITTPDLEEYYDCDFVYDIETDSGHFHVAPGNLVVHNTDSVMIKFPKEFELADVFDISKRLAKIVTEEIGKKEIELEFEKVYFGYLLYMKKKYAGMKMERLEEEPKLAIKGLNPVRGDKMPIVKTVSKQILQCLLIDKDAKKAIQCLKDALQATVDDKLDPADFLQEKKLAKSIDLYPPGTLHVRVAREMRKRDPGTAPGAGEMVKFLVVEGREKINAVDFDHFMKNRTRYRLDYEYYLKNLMCAALGDLLNLKGIHDDPYRLFEPYLTQAHSHKLHVKPITSFFKKAPMDTSGFVKAPGLAPAPSRMKIKKDAERAKKAMAKK